MEIPSPLFFYILHITSRCVVGGGGGFNRPKTKKGLKKELKTGDIKLPMSLCCKYGGTL
jgi:hypothetical protein